MARSLFCNVALFAATASQLCLVDSLTEAAPAGTENNMISSSTNAKSALEPVLPTFRVVNGDPVASASEVEWYAGLLSIKPLEDGRIYYEQCGGSLITSGWVLTAAHCLYDTDLRQYRKPAIVPHGNASVPNILIQLGGLRSPTAVGPSDTTTESAEDSNGEVRFAVQVVCHPKYGGAAAQGAEGYANDICLLRLNAPSTRKPLPLNIVTEVHTRADVDAAETAGRSTVVYGFGDTQFDGNSSDILLRSQSMPLVSLSQCHEAWAEENYGHGYTRAQFKAIVEDMGNNIVCTDTTVSDSCQGDSGGPLIDEQTGFQIGVVSLGSGCASGVPAVYTKVSAYKDWILATMSSKFQAAA